MGKPKISHSKKNKASNFSNPINAAHINSAQNLIDTDFSILSGKTIASEDTWLEDKAISQLKHVETFENMCCVVGMPDLHPGIDAPIGAAYLSQNHIYPALVGSDIGCGIALWETNLMSNHASPEKLIKKLGNLDLGLDKTWYSHIDERRLEIGLKHADFDSSLGTIGGGNHFAEITQIDTIYDDYAEKYDLKIDKLHLLIHTGSRGLGQVIFKKYTQEGGNKGLNHSNIRSQQYLDAHDQVLLFAQLNRELVAKHMLQRLQTTGREILSVHHNFVEKVTEKDAEKDAENIKDT